MPALTICSIVARNYLPRARVLAQSVLRHHPEARIAVLLVDELGPGALDDATGEPFEVLHLADVELGGAIGREMAGSYDVLELSTAVKPWLLEHLVHQTEGPVLYLDADVEVHDRIDGLAALVATHDLAVTPHVLRPVPRDGRFTDESALLAAGMFNLGFVGVGPGAIGNGFLAFWKERLRRDGTVDPARNRFTDQRWMDFVHCFPHVVLDDPGCNVAYWNLWGRSLSRFGGRVLVDGQPLRFFHFSGFDPESPHLLSRHQGPRPRVLLSEHPVAADLCRRYAAALVEAGHGQASRIPYRWARTRTGMALDPLVRAIYRDGLIAADDGGGDPVPGPFDPDGGARFGAWLAAPVGATGVPRYLASLCARHGDLAAAFPAPLELPSSAAALCHWARVTVVDPRATAARAVLDAGDPLTVEPSRLPLCDGTAPDIGSGRRGPGINLFGYLRAEDGVGEVMRLLAAAAASVGLPHSTHPDRWTPSSLAHEAGEDPGPPWAWDTNVFCVNADVLGRTLDRLGTDPRIGRHSAALWAWETEVFPDRFHQAFDLVDEVWAPSRFAQGALERAGRGPVHVLPVPVVVPRRRTALSRGDLGLPEGFLVLFIYSWRSIGQRKNPAAVVDAFTAAFEPGDGAHLVLKSIGGSDHVSELEALRLRTERPDVHIVDGPVRAGHLGAMLDHCDCYVSLHRSEGFGLTMAEAMVRAKPVVATGWSANLEFMDERTAHLVPATTVPIGDDVPVYAGAGRWAEPDVVAAAAAIRRVHDDPAGSAALGERARAHLARTRTPERTGRVLAEYAARLRQALPNQLAGLPV